MTANVKIMHLSVSEGNRRRMPHDGLRHGFSFITEQSNTEVSLEPEMRKEIGKKEKTLIV